MRTLYEILLTVLLIGVAIAAYHIWIVAPMVQAARPHIYVLDVDSLIRAEKDKSVSAILAGKDVDPDTVARNVQRRMVSILSRTPPDAIVLDRSAVLKGGREIVQYGGR